MILTIDVGNTNITCGVFKGDEIVATFRITTKMPRTSDEYGMILYNLLEQNEIKPSDIKDTIICSVVPNVMHSLHGAFAKYFHINPIVVEAGIKTGIRIVTPNPQQIGADRIVDAVGAYEIYGGPVLVIDFGTATTYDFVDASGAFLGELQLRESASRRRLCRRMPRSFLPSRSRSRIVFLARIPSRACRPELSTDRSVRRNISSTR